MLPRTSLSGLLLIAVITGNSCGIMSKGDRIEYNFDEGTKHRRLVLAIPPGTVTEQHRRDESGVLVRTFRYKDGAEFFIACRDSDQQPTITLTKSSDDLQSVAKSTGQIGSGTYPNGTHWSRQSRDGFIVGYDYVQETRLAEFDKSIHSIQIKK